MSINELMRRLAALQAQGFGERDVMILDSHNGGGHPRELNLGPTTRTITPDDAAETADCEEREGDGIIIIGFGCY